MKKNQWLQYGMPIGAIFLLLFSMVKTCTHPKPVAQTPTFAAASSPFTEQVGGVGVTEPQSETISISALIPGIVSKIYVKVGDKLMQGDPLFTVDTRDAEARLISARAALASVQIQAEDSAHQLQLYEKVSDKRAVSNDELSRRRFASQLAAARVKEAMAQVKVLETELERLTVKAPVDSTVLRINIRPGEFAQTSPSADLVLLGDIDIMHVRVEIDESEALQVAQEAKAVGFMRGFAGQQIPLTFVRKEPYVVAKKSLTGGGGERVDTRVQEVIYAFDNKEVGSFVGQQMDVFIARVSQTKTGDQAEKAKP